jgi:hypothetical protein
VNPCEAPGGCDHIAQPGGLLCSAHYRRQQRKQPMHAPIRAQLAPWDALCRAMRELEECDTDNDAAFRLAQARLRAARLRFVRSANSPAQLVKPEPLPSLGKRKSR